MPGTRQESVHTGFLSEPSYGHTVPTSLTSSSRVEPGCYISTYPTGGWTVNTIKESRAVTWVFRSWGHRVLNEKLTR